MTKLDGQTDCENFQKGVWQISEECVAIFKRACGKNQRRVWQFSKELVANFGGVCGNFQRSLWQISEECVWQFSKELVANFDIAAVDEEHQKPCQNHMK